MLLNNNLQQLMRVHGNLSVSDLAKLVNIPQPTLHHILSGSTKSPRKKLLATLADFFSVSIKQLIGDEPLPNVIPEKIKQDLKLSTVPIIPWGMIKKWPTNDFIDLKLNEILLDKKVSDHSFGLIIQDASLEPMFPENALLIFDFEKEPLDRHFVLTHLKKNDHIVLNRLFIENNERYIKLDRADGNAKLIKLDLVADRIIGTLIEVRIPY